MSQFLFRQPHSVWFPAHLQPCTLVTDQNQRPVPAKIQWSADRLVVDILEDRCGRVHATVPTASGGAVLLSTPWLFPRLSGYRLELELLRGLVSRIRNGAEMWQANQLDLPADFQETMKRITRRFIHFWSQKDFDKVAADAFQFLQELIGLSNRLSDQLLMKQGHRPFEHGTSRSDSDGFLLGARLQVDAEATERDLVGDHLSGQISPLQMLCGSQVLNWVQVHQDWTPESAFPDSDAGSSTTCLESVIAKLKQARKQVVLGPVFDVGRDRLPGSDTEGTQGDRLRKELVDTLRSQLPRLATEVGLLHLVSGINGVGVNGLTPTFQAELVTEALEVANTIAPYTQLMISFDQPFCERHGWSVGGQSVEYFLTKLAKQRTPLHAIGLEFNIGYFPRGTMPRTDLDWITQMHSWSIWEVPIYVLLRVAGIGKSDGSATNSGNSRSQVFPPVVSSTAGLSQRESISHLVQLFSALPWVNGILFPGLTDVDPLYPEKLSLSDPSPDSIGYIFRG